MIILMDLVFTEKLRYIRAKYIRVFGNEKNLSLRYILPNVSDCTPIGEETVKCFKIINET